MNRPLACWPCVALAEQGRPFRCLVLAWALAAAALAQAGTPPAARDTGGAPNELFQKAGRAYDAGQYREAAALYEQLVARGQVPVAVWFNLGNARFREGQSSAAVLDYRRAWYLAPRDADVHANLQFAIEQTGASLPPVGWSANLLQFASLREWAGLAVVGLWVGALSACGLLLLPARRVLWRAGLAAGLVALLLGLAGAGYWLDLQRRPEAVVLQPTQALFAPLAGATVHFALPAGALVRIEAQSGAWLHITRGRQTGWVPRDRCAKVCPLQAAGGGLY